MSPILCLLFFVASSSATRLAPQQLEHFFDAVLEEGRHLVTVNTNFPDHVAKIGSYVSVSWEGMTTRGPTTLERSGSSTGYGTRDQAHAEGMARLGTLNFNVEKLTFNFFGHSYSTELHFSILGAESPVTIDIFRNNLATCQVSVNVLPPVGNYVVHFRALGAPSFVSALLDYGISYLLKLAHVNTSFLNRFVPDLTSRINRDLTIAARRVAC